MRRTLLATAAAVGLALPHTAEAAFVENFDSFTPTTAFNTTSSPGSDEIFGGLGSVTRDGSGTLGIFNTDNVSNTAAADGDLDADVGNVLILQKAGDTTPDDDENGGTFRFSFSNLDLTSMTFLDIEPNEAVEFFVDGTKVGAFAGGGTSSGNTFQPDSVVTVDFTDGTLATTGSSSVTTTFALADFIGLGDLDVVLTPGTSAAISEITAVPLPGAVVLFASGAALIGYVSRRSRRREVGTAA